IPLAGAVFGGSAGQALEQLRIRGKVTADGLEAGLLVGPGASHDFVGFEAGGGLDGGLDAAEVVDARQLDEDLVAAELVRLDGGLLDAEGVNAGANDIDGLIEGALLDLGDGGGLHG